MVNIQSKLSHLLALYYTCVSIFVYYCAIYLRSTSICAIKQHMDILNISGYPSILSSHLSSQIEVSLVQNVHRLCYCTVTVDFVVVDKRFYTPPSKYITKRNVTGKELTRNYKPNYTVYTHRLLCYFLIRYENDALDFAPQKLPSIGKSAVCQLGSVRFVKLVRHYKPIISRACHSSLKISMKTPSFWEYSFFVHHPRTS